MISPQFRSTRIATLGVARGFLATLAGSANAQATKWKFEKGKTLRYDYTEKNVSKAEIAGQAIDTTVSQTLELVWKIDSADGDKAKITQTINGIKFVMDSPFAKIDYDTKERDKAPADPFGSSFSKIMNVLADSKTTFTMDSRGEISDVSTDDKTVKGLKAATAMPGASGPSADGLKAVILQTAMVLPDKTLAKGASWKDTVKLPDPPFGDKTLDSTFTAQGDDESAGTKVLKIAVASVAKYTPKEGAGFVKKIKEQSISGSILFDPPAGNILSSKIVEKSEESMTLQGNEIAQKIEKTRTVTRKK
ncbi:MAG: hypothetical protein NVSMB14_07300 [Isosphaeraceae bacterium]